MITREQICAELETWKGTPFVHQGREKGARVDCIGLMIGVAKACGVDVIEIDFTAYGPLPVPARMEAELDKRLDRVRPGEEMPGDIAWMRDPIMGGQPRHLAMLTKRGTIIHAHSGAANGRMRNPGRVIEERLDAAMRNKVRRFYRFRGLK